MLFSTLQCDWFRTDSPMYCDLIDWDDNRLPTMTMTGNNHTSNVLSGVWHHQCQLWPNSQAVPVATTDGTWQGDDYMDRQWPAMDGMWLGRFAMSLWMVQATSIDMSSMFTTLRQHHSYSMLQVSEGSRSDGSIMSWIFDPKERLVVTQ